MQPIRIIAASLLLASAGAHAAQGYLGVGLGAGKADYSVDQFVADTNDGSFVSARVDNGDSVFRLFGGVAFNPHLALEVAYTDLGELTAQGISDGSVYYMAGPVDISEEATALSFAVRGSAPLNETFSLFGKLGLASWDADYTGSNGPVTVSESDSGTDPYLALGASANLNDNFSAQLEFSRYSDVADVDVDTATVSLSYSFR